MAKCGLVLEGGAMRGMFTAGVLDVFMENGIEFDGVIGVSAGATFGCNFISKQIGRTIRYNKKYCRDKRYCSFHSLITTGDLYGVDFCYNKLPNELDPFDNDAFRKSKIDFYIVATDIVSGEPVYKKYDVDEPDALSWMRASASMPLASGIVEIDGRKTLPANVVVKEKQQGRVVLLITIREGRNRQIRKMCEAVGLEVARLRRISIGPLKLGMLKPGTWRELTAEELRALRTAIGKEK